MTAKTRNPYLGMHPDLFPPEEQYPTELVEAPSKMPKLARALLQEAKKHESPEARRKAEQTALRKQAKKEHPKRVRELFEIAGSRRAATLSDREVEILAAAHRGETPVFAELESLTTDQIRELPRRSFTDEEWERLDEDDQEHIIENDTESQARVDALADPFIDRWQSEKDRAGDDDNVSEYFHDWLGNTGRLYDLLPGNRYTDLVGYGDERGIDRDEVREMISEYLGDPSNYSLDTDRGYGAVWEWEVEGQVYIEGSEIAPLLAVMTEDEKERAVAKISDGTDRDITPDVSDLDRVATKRNGYYREFEETFQTGVTVYANIDWDHVSEAIEETIRERAPEDQEEDDEDEEIDLDRIEITGKVPKLPRPAQPVVYEWPDGTTMVDIDVDDDELVGIAEALGILGIQWDGTSKNKNYLKERIISDRIRYHGRDEDGMPTFRRGELSYGLESLELNHCVGWAKMGYMDAVRRGEIKILSMRSADPKAARPIFTIEASIAGRSMLGPVEGRKITSIQQIKGFNNWPPGFKNNDHVDVDSEGKINRLTGAEIEEIVKKFRLKSDEVQKIIEWVLSVGVNPHSVHDPNFGGHDLWPALNVIRLMADREDPWAMELQAKIDAASADTIADTFTELAISDSAGSRKVSPSHAEALRAVIEWRDKSQERPDWIHAGMNAARIINAIERVGPPVAATLYLEAWRRAAEDAHGTLAWEATDDRGWVRTIRGATTEQEARDAFAAEVSGASIDGIRRINPASNPAQSFCEHGVCEGFCRPYRPPTTNPTPNPEGDSRYWVVGVSPPARPGIAKFDDALKVARRQAKQSKEPVDIVWGVVSYAPLEGAKTDIFGRTIVEPTGAARRARRMAKRPKYRQRRRPGPAEPAIPLHVVATVLPDGELIVHSPEDVPASYAEGQAAPRPTRTRSQAGKLGATRVRRRKKIADLRKAVAAALDISQQLEETSSARPFVDAVIEAEAAWDTSGYRTMRPEVVAPAEFRERMRFVAGQIAELRSSPLRWSWRRVYRDGHVDELTFVHEVVHETSSGPRIAISYEIVTLDDVVRSEVSERGWDNEDGIVMEDEGRGLAHATMNMLRREGATEASSSAFHSGVWYTEHGERDPITGRQRNRAFFLLGFTEDQEREVFDLFASRRLPLAPRGAAWGEPIPPTPIAPFRTVEQRIAVVHGIVHPLHSSSMNFVDEIVNSMMETGLVGESVEAFRERILNEADGPFAARVFDATSDVATFDLGSREWVLSSGNGRIRVETPVAGSATVRRPSTSPTTGGVDGIPDPWFINRFRLAVAVALDVRDRSTSIDEGESSDFIAAVVNYDRLGPSERRLWESVEHLGLTGADPSDLIEEFSSSVIAAAYSLATWDSRGGVHGWAPNTETPHNPIIVPASGNVTAYDTIALFRRISAIELRISSVLGIHIPIRPSGTMSGPLRNTLDFLFSIFEYIQANYRSMGGVQASLDTATMSGLVTYLEGLSDNELGGTARRAADIMTGNGGPPWFFSGFRIVSHLDDAELPLPHSDIYREVMAAIEPSRVEHYPVEWARAVMTAIIGLASQRAMDGVERGSFTQAALTELDSTVARLPNYAGQLSPREVVVRVMDRMGEAENYRLGGQEVSYRTLMHRIWQEIHDWRLRLPAEALSPARRDFVDEVIAVAGRVEPALPERYQRVYDRVIEAMNRADEIGGPEDDHFVEMMRMISEIAQFRAEHEHADQYNEDQFYETLSDDVARARVAPTWVRPVVGVMDELETIATSTQRMAHPDAYRQFMERISSVALARGERGEAGRTERRRPPARPVPQVLLTAEQRIASALGLAVEDEPRRYGDVRARDPGAHNFIMAVLSQMAGGVEISPTARPGDPSRSDANAIANTLDDAVLRAQVRDAADAIAQRVGSRGWRYMGELIPTGQTFSPSADTYAEQAQREITPSEPDQLYGAFIDALRAADGPDVGGMNLSDDDYFSVMNTVQSVARGRSTDGPSYGSIPTHEGRASTGPIMTQIRRLMSDAEIASVGQLTPEYRRLMGRVADYAEERIDARRSLKDMSQVTGQPEAVDAAESAVALHQNLLLTPPRSSTTYLIERIPTIMPPVGGRPPPLVSVSSSIIPPTLGGGGSREERREAIEHGTAQFLNKIEEASGGVLFLEDIAEFNTDALRALKAKLLEMTYPPLIVATYKEDDTKTRIDMVDEILKFPIRATMLSHTDAATHGWATDSSEIIRARIESSIAPEDAAAARYQAMEMGRPQRGDPRARGQVFLQSLRTGDPVTFVRDANVTGMSPGTRIVVRQNRVGRVTGKDLNGLTVIVLGDPIAGTIDNKVYWDDDDLIALPFDIEVRDRAPEIEIETPEESARKARRAFRARLKDGVRIRFLRDVRSPYPTFTVPRGTLATLTYVSRDRLCARMDDVIPGAEDLDNEFCWDGPDQPLARDFEIYEEEAPRMIELNPTDNPGWVTKLLAKHLEFLEENVPARWLPKLTAVSKGRGTQQITAAMREYGCGAYGCVLPTLDPKVVLKVTTDETEYQFARDLAHKLSVQVTVEYQLVMDIPEKYKGRSVYLLWRDSAERVGEIDKASKKRANTVENAVDVQHKAAQQAYVDIMQGAPSAIESIENWVGACRDMGKIVPELHALSLGMIKNLQKNKVFMGDVHAGNIGRVGKRWLVIDPGNIAVLKK